MTYTELHRLYQLPFFDLLKQARAVHEENWPEREVQLCTLLSIKTGGCSEDCGYCAQSARYHTSVKAERLMETAEVLNVARSAKENGSTRFCMGAAWRAPKDREVEKVADMVRAVNALGLETCATLGMLSPSQAQTLKSAGLAYYNHNLDTAPEHYGEIIHTRDFQDRLDTLAHVRAAGLKTCCGGIVGLGEGRHERAGLLQALANLPEHPQSVPINRLVQVEGTPLHGTEALDPLEFVRSIAVARLLMPQAVVRLSAGRSDMSDELQALCFLAGANSIFYGEKLLTTGNPDVAHDQALFERLGLSPMPIAGSDERAPRRAVATAPTTVHASICATTERAA